MRLRELELPFAVIQPDQLYCADDFGWFQDVDEDQVLRGYFDEIRFIDNRGLFYVAETVILIDKPWWKRLPFLGNRGVYLDFNLAEARQLDTVALRSFLIDHLISQPELIYGGEVTKGLDELDKLFPVSATLPDLIRSIGYFSKEKFVAMPPQRSSKVVDERTRKD